MYLTSSHQLVFYTALLMHLFDVTRIQQMLARIHTYTEVNVHSSSRHTIYTYNT